MFRESVERFNMESYLYRSWLMIEETFRNCSVPSLTPRLCSPRVTPIEEGEEPLVQWAAHNTQVSVIKMAPQKCLPDDVRDTYNITFIFA
jgi:hypothetical protein